MRVLEVAESALRFPLRGRIVPELRNPAIRELFANGYRVIYRVESLVIVLAVIHERRSLQVALGLDG
jgi:toxin ParE1/3/4